MMLTALEVVERFFLAWEKQDFTSMQKSAQITWKSKYENPAQVLRGIFSNKQITAFEVEREPKKWSEVMFDVKVHVEYVFYKEPFRTTITARVICEKGVRKPSKDGEWGVNPISCLNEEVQRTNERMHGA